MRLCSRYRIYPTKAQAAKLGVQFGCARWVYNEALDRAKERYLETGEHMPYSEMQARLPKLKESEPWLREADSQVLQCALINLATAYHNFYTADAGLPRHKRLHGRQCVQYPQRVRIANNYIRLPKVGMVKVKLHREFTGTIKTIAVIKECSGDFYISITPQDKETQSPSEMEGRVFLGVDVGLTSFAVTSKGEKVGNPRLAHKADRNLRNKRKRFKRKTKGSRSQERARIAYAKAHEHVANARKDFLHKLSRRLVDENQALAVEDLAVMAMMRKRWFNAAIADASWRTFTTFLEYKCALAGKPFIRVDRFFPSSKLCSVCGYRCETMPLSVRSWKCEGCGLVHDRDINAARNIGLEADRIWAVGTTAPAAGGKIKRRGWRKSTLSAAAVERRSLLSSSRTVNKLSTSD